MRFSTVVGSRGSADLARDVRGFATKFYTTQGNFDLVGNNMPVFFIQDGIKFPDLVHAVKPEPHNEMPQAASAHDTFWDFVSLVPETLHMVMWVMSDRGLPRSYRMMEGFGVHTFRLVNAAGNSVLCKFHWKPLLGAHSLVWDEAQKISGKDPDFHRRDLWEAIEEGNYPEYELGLQVDRREDELALGFDLLDPTKLLPEELVPVRRVGKLTLDRNPHELLRRGRAGRLLRRQRRARHRLHQRPAAAGAAVLVPRHAAHAPRRAELRRAARSTVRSRRSTTTSRTASPARPSRLRELCITRTASRGTSPLWPIPPKASVTSPNA